MNTGADSYNFEQKNIWRRWAYKKAISRLAGNRRGVVLYLAGPEDIDRKLFTGFGYNDNKLIAIDRSAQVVKQHRRNGKLAICGDLKTVVMAWPETPKIDLVVADFCNGATVGNAYFFETLIFSPGVHENTQVVLNLFGGREKDGFLKESKTMFPYIGKHRGQLMFEYFAWYIWESSRATGSEDIYPFHVIRDWVYERCKPRFNQYRAAKSYAYMQSCVFSLGGIILKQNNRNKAQKDKLLTAQFDEFQRVRKSCVAIKAHMTRRGHGA